MFSFVSGTPKSPYTLPVAIGWPDDVLADVVLLVLLLLDDDDDVLIPFCEAALLVLDLLPCLTALSYFSLASSSSSSAASNDGSNDVAKLSSPANWAFCRCTCYTCVYQ